jgi:hypothetical protein
MLVAIREGHDDVHHRRRQRQEPFDLVSVTHVGTMTTLDLLCQLSTEWPPQAIGPGNSGANSRRPDTPSLA